MTMTITATLILCTVISSVITVAVKVIWDWASNKNGKKQIDDLEDDFKEEIDKIKSEFKEEIDDKLNIFVEIKFGLDEQRKEFADLKNLILLEYLKKSDFEKFSERFLGLRDIVITNKNNIEMIKESSKQNLSRMTNLENRLTK